MTCIPWLNARLEALLGLALQNLRELNPDDLDQAISHLRQAREWAPGESAYAKLLATALAGSCCGRESDTALAEVEPLLIRALALRPTDAEILYLFKGVYAAAESEAVRRSLKLPARPELQRRVSKLNAVTGPATGD